MPTVKFQLRRDTAANWTAVNPTLGPGEPALEINTRRVKYGDGVTAWNDLPYSSVPATSFIQTLLDDLDEAAARATLGVPSYAIGAWSPVLSFSTPPTTPFTMDVLSAQYTKIGRQVTVSAFFRTDNVNLAGAAGYLQVRGLPFVASGYYPARVIPLSGWNVSPSDGYVDNGTSNIYLMSKSAADGVASLMGTGAVTAGAAPDANSLMVSATYFT